MNKMCVYAIVLTTISFSYCFAMNKPNKSFHERRMELEVQRKNDFEALGENAGSDIKHDFYKKYKFKLVNLVEKATDISNKEKLEYLEGDIFYKMRRELIRNMIDKEGVNPNAIVYDGDKTPLRESIQFKDLRFTNYLFKRGAIHDTKTWKLLDEDSLFAALLDPTSDEARAALRKELEELAKKWESTRNTITLSWMIEGGFGEAYYQERKAILDKYGVELEEVRSYAEEAKDKEHPIFYW